MLFRSPRPDELDTVYRMGFDVWAEGKDETAYLAECRASPKYRANEWCVAEDAGTLVASLLIHRFDDEVFGIGSLATPPESRGKGFASELIQYTIDRLEKKDGATLIYLYADIDPEFYTRFGFRALPADLQKYPGSVCMAKIQNPNFKITSPPKYF